MRYYLVSHGAATFHTAQRHYCHNYIHAREVYFPSASCFLHVALRLDIRQGGTGAALIYGATSTFWLWLWLWF